MTTIRPGFGGMLQPRWTGYGPASPAGVVPLLGPPAPSSFQKLVTGLVNELAARPATARRRRHPTRGAPGPAVAAVPGPIDALTARELQVLDLLAEHVGHVLDKLGAANRTEAVARARQLGLIS